MSDSQLFDWPTAKEAMLAGWQVRRVGWTDHWLTRWLGGLYWLVFNDGTMRVVQNTDFGSNEFLALDWTNLSPGCVTAGTTPGTQANGCALPYSPPQAATTPTGSIAGTGNNTVSPSQQPGNGGGGGGMTGSGSNTTTSRRTTPAITWPVITVTPTDQNTDACYDMAGTVNDQVTANIQVNVALSLPTGYAGPDIFFVTVRNGGTILGNFTLAPGGNQDVAFTGQSTPGGSFTFNARAWAGGSPDIQNSGTVTLKSACRESGDEAIGGGGL